MNLRIEALFLELRDQEGHHLNVIKGNIISTELPNIYIYICMYLFIIYTSNFDFYIYELVDKNS